MNETKTVCQSGRVSESAATRLRSDIECWERWVEWIEDRPLDSFEFEAALMARDGIDELLEITNDQAAIAQPDGLDVRFEAVTVVRSHGRFDTERPDRSGWWWQRVPSDPESFAYLLGDY